MMMKTMELQAVMPSLLVIVVMCGSVMMAPPIIQNGTMSQAQEEDQPVSETLSKVNSAKPWLIEGDIAVKMDGRKIITGPTVRWPNAIVIYTFHPELPANVRSTIQTAMSIYERSTCVRFILRTSQANYVQFKSNEEGCWSFVGMIGNKQELNLGPGCNFLSTIMHEIGHAIGMFHEQSRPDRDQYITILTQNVDEEFQFNFDIANNSETFGVPYDFLSIMHYGQHAFASSPNLVTIQAKPDYSQFQNTMGTGTVLTCNDIAAINRAYCPSLRTAIPTQFPEVNISSLTTPASEIVPYVECVGDQEVSIGADQLLSIASKNFPDNLDKTLTGMACRVRLVPAANTQLAITVLEYKATYYSCSDVLSIKDEVTWRNVYVRRNQSPKTYSFGNRPVIIYYRSRRCRRLYNREQTKSFLMVVHDTSSNIKFEI